MPVIVTPHPLNDLKPDEVKDLARSVYPLIIMQLTSQAELAPTVHADFVHPAKGMAQRAEPADTRKGAP